MPKIIRKKTYISPPLSLKDFHDKHNKIVIWHEKGGLGDVFMHRMLLNDIKELAPNCEIIFACLPEYIDAIKDHPAISQVIDARTVNPKDYTACYNTCVTIVDRYENMFAPNCNKHRSDIWAEYLEITLNTHEMNIQISPENKEKAKKILEKYKKPIILFSPISKMITKSLLPNQIKVIAERTKNCTLIGIHNREIKELTDLEISGIYNENIETLIAIINEVDYIISVDSAVFHIAGGLKKPLLGIFTFADGKIYGKYFDFVLVQKHKDDGNWACGPCFKFAECPKFKGTIKPCLTEIDEAMLKDGIDKMFLKWSK